MPGLLNLTGQLAKVVSLIKFLGCPKNISVEGEVVANNTPLVKIIHKIVDALITCNSNLSLVTNLTSTKENGPLTKTRTFPHETLRKWRQHPNQLARLVRLRLVVSGLQNSILLV